MKMLVALALVVMSGVADAGQAIRISVDKHTGFAPLDIRVRLLVERSPDNLGICIHVDGPFKTDMSCFPHTDKDVSERTALFKELPEGEYAFWAELLRKGNKSVSSDVLFVEVK